MAKKKIYAVRKGKITGTFHTWEECKAAVEGYPGAEYRGFATKAEADAYLKGRNSLPDTDELNMEAMDTAILERTVCLPNQVIAYVDGSFDEKIGRYSFGCVMLTPDGVIIRESGNGNNPESVALRNVTGEMLGAMFAVKWCEVNGYSAVELCYDYKGIEMWATGGWKAKNDLTQKYAAFMQESGRKLHITFRKIAAHTGNKYNEEADKLAKTALVEGNGIPRIRKRD